jgi:RNA polymerase sigma factor (sigma-70 family)
MAEQVSDAILLERFVSRREEAAFVALVKRHGPRVVGTCRRVLRNEHDIEDVFQATFLVLARKAAAIPWRESVGSWLCAVAHRLAMSARADVSRHERRETSFATLVPAALARGGAGRLPEKYHPLTDTFVEVERLDLRQVLDDELLQLPEKYRAPVVLCDLQGRTHQEAALELGWPSGSISRRLERARALLRRRLVCRGVTLAVGLAGVGLALLAWNAAHKGDRGAREVRQVMSQLKPTWDGRAGVANLLAGINRDESLPEPAQILTLARQAAQVAAQIVTHDPGRNRDDWRNYAVAMRLSAVQLAQATEENNGSMMLSAARQLDASCLNCHEVFR